MEIRQGASQTDTLGLLIPVLAATFLVVFVVFFFEGNLQTLCEHANIGRKKTKMSRRSLTYAPSLWACGAGDINKKLHL